uniref:radical SAM family heme chaperone HemW n=1 Tax=Buchnera aphidicola TaxID=9 RepID=UPI003F5CCB0E
MINYLPPLSLYIHIPWCLKKCDYCDFNVHKYQKKIDQNNYIKHVILDLRNNLPLILNRNIKTVFIGGGSPGLIKIEIIKKLINKIKEILKIKNKIEITIEINPNKKEIYKINQFVKAGINRISIGIQTFNKKNMVLIGRNQELKNIMRSVKIVKSTNCKNFNIDIIYGLPNQTIEEAIYDIKKAIKLKPDHISWYQLTVEKNTILYYKKPILPNENVLYKITKLGNKILKNNGFYQYEISSYAKKNKKCKHNLNYWRFGDYLGIGCGAHSKITQSNNKILRIIKNKRPIDFIKGKYINKKYEILKKDKIIEYFMNYFRIYEKVSIKKFSKYTNIKEKDILPKIQKAIKHGYITKNKNNLNTTKKGKLFLNDLLEIFI